LTISQLIPQGGSVQMNKMGESVPGSQRAVQTAQHWWVGYPEDEPLPGCNIPSHYATQCEALDGTPLPAPLCKLLRVPQGTKWGRHEEKAPEAPAATEKAREEEC
jgi:hypothetical protein